MNTQLDSATSEHTIFRLDSSIRVEGSATRGVADTLEAALLDRLTNAEVLRRDVGLDPIDATVWRTSALAGFVPPEQHTTEQQAARATATELADELAAADAFVFATPLYNFGVSQHIKTWFDLVLTDPRFGPGSTEIAGRPAFLVVARGGGYGPGTPREGWDHATGWLLRILVDIWGLDVKVIEAELTLADITPAMESLRGLAAENLRNAHQSAEQHAQVLADQLVSAKAA